MFEEKTIFNATVRKNGRSLKITIPPSIIKLYKLVPTDILEIEILKKRSSLNNE